MTEKLQTNPLAQTELKEWFDSHLGPDAWEGSRLLDKSDFWVADREDGIFYKALQKLTMFFDQFKDEAGVYVEEENMTDFIQVLAYTKTTPSVRILGLLGQCQPGLGGDLLQACEKNNKEGHEFEAESKVVLARVKLLARMELYGQVFGPERRKQVLAILENIATQEKGINEHA